VSTLLHELNVTNYATNWNIQKVLIEHKS